MRCSTLNLFPLMGNPSRAGQTCLRIVAIAIFVSLTSVVVVGQPEADSSFLDGIASLVPEVHAIGDSTGFGLSKKAVSEAA